MYYALGLGWHVLPLHHVLPDGTCSCKNTNAGHKPGKHPRLKAWGAIDDFSEATVSGWLSQWPDANLGIACGKRTGLVMLGPDGEQGLEDWGRLERELGAVPPTLTQLTGTSPGRHYLWKWPADGLPFPTGANLHGTRIDARGCDADGRPTGQFVVAPSRNGAGPYRWLEGHGPGEIEPAELPQAWLDWAREGGPLGGPKGPDAGGAPGGPPGTLTAPTAPGGRPSDEARCRMVLEAIEPAISGQGGHGRLFYAARCAVRGFSLDDGLSQRLLEEAYNPRCAPPWSAAEIAHKVKDAREKPFGKPWGWLRDAGDTGDAVKAAKGAQPGGAAKVPDAGGVHLTDRGNAELLARQSGADLRHVLAWRKWLRWDGARWAPSSAEEVRGLGAAMLKAMFRRASDQIRALGEAAADDPDKAARLLALQRVQRWAVKSEMAARLNAMPDLLRSEPGLMVSHDRLDADRWLLNCPNGTLDLRAGVLRPHDRADLLTSLCPTRYDPAAACPRWKAFLEQVFVGAEGRPDFDLIDYVQRLLGYCLTGDVSTHMLPVFWGGGGNGKGTLINTILHVMGADYATPANADFLTVRHGERHPTEVADLFGRRLVSCQETAEGAGLNEPLVKWLTGADVLKARRMREDLWAFQPTHKLVLSTNHKPVVKGSDHGIWRRLRLVPFVRKFEGEAEDRGLPEKLRGESEGILAWLVRGCLDWFAQGELPPEAVLLATKQYREEQDRVAEFLAERCELRAGARCPAGQLYAAYKAWCEANGDKRPMSQTAFGSRLSAKGIEKAKASGIYREGVRLKPQPQGQ